MKEETVIIHVPLGVLIPKEHESCCASSTFYTYDMYICCILQQYIHPEDGSTFLEVQATRSYASSGTYHPIKVAQTGATLLSLLQEQIATFPKMIRSLKEARKGDETEAAGDTVARCDRAIDWACHDLEEARQAIEDILRDVARLFSPPEVKDLVLTLTILIHCLVDWLELDEGCTCDGPLSEHPCLTCSSHLAVTQARRWLQILTNRQKDEPQ